MESGSVKDKVLDIVREKTLLGDDLDLTTKIGEEFGKDSLDRAELVMEFEDEFDIIIPEDIESKIKTVGDMVKYIEDQLKHK